MTPAQTMGSGLGLRTSDLGRGTLILASENGYSMTTVGQNVGEDGFPITNVGNDGKAGSPMITVGHDD